MVSFLLRPFLPVLGEKGLRLLIGFRMSSEPPKSVLFHRLTDILVQNTFSIFIRLRHRSKRGRKRRV